MPRRQRLAHGTEAPPIMSAPLPSGSAGRPTPSIYDQLSGVYDRWFDRFEDRLRREALRLLDLQPGERVIELGTGTGRALPLLCQAVAEGGRVVGIDLSAGMLRRARRRLGFGRCAAPVALVRARLPHAPFAPACADAVFLSFTLELFEPAVILQVLGATRRLMRTSGRLAIASLWRSTHPGWMERSYTWAHRLAPAVLDCRPIDLDHFLQLAGFTIPRAATHNLFGLPVRLALARPT